MYEERQGAVFGTQQCTTSNGEEVSVFTLSQSVEKSVASALAGSKTIHGERGSWCRGHPSRKRAVASSFYVRSDA